MSKRVLILGADAIAARVIRRARRLGFYTVLADVEPSPEWFLTADECCAAELNDPESIRQVAQQYRVDGIYPPSGFSVIFAAIAAAALGIPGPSPEAAARIAGQGALWQALVTQGVPAPPFRVARTVEEAHAAAMELGVPLVVRPADGTGGTGARRVEHIEDVSLAFAKAIGVSRIRAAIIAPALDGDVFQVEGYVSQGRFVRLGILGRELSAPPFLFDTGVFAPPPLDAAREEIVSKAVDEAVSAVALTAGWVSAQCMYTAQGPRMVEIAGHPFCAQLPRDVWWMAEGHDSIADCLRVTVGECPPAKPCSRGAALYWISTRSGIVTEIRGVDEARAVTGVEEVHIVAKPGDIMRHVVDCAARDRVGYVTAAGATVEDAMAAAGRARDLCEVVTRPAY